MHEYERLRFYIFYRSGLSLTSASLSLELLVTKVLLSDHQVLYHGQYMIFILQSILQYMYLRYLLYFKYSAIGSYLTLCDLRFFRFASI